MKLQINCIGCKVKVSNFRHFCNFWSTKNYLMCEFQLCLPSIPIQ